MYSSSSASSSWASETSNSEPLLSDSSTEPFSSYSSSGSDAIEPSERSSTSSVGMGVSFAFPLLFGGGKDTYRVTVSNSPQK